MNQLIGAYGPACISALTGTGRHHLPYFFRMGNAIGTPNFSSAGGLICLGPRRTGAVMTGGLFAGVDYFGKVRPAAFWCGVPILPSAARMANCNG